MSYSQRPSTGYDYDRHNHRVTIDTENQLVPLRTRYIVRQHPELPGWRLQSSTPEQTGAINMTITRHGLAQTQGAHSLPTFRSTRTPAALSALALPKRESTKSFTVVSPREYRLAVDPIPHEVRVPVESPWVARNISTVPRLHMHRERIAEDSLPPLTAPPPAQVMQAVKSEKEEKQMQFISLSPTEKGITPIPETEESYVCIRSQGSESVDDDVVKKWPLPFRPARDGRWREAEPCQTRVVIPLFRKFVAPLEWATSGHIEPTIYMKSRAVTLIPPHHIRTNSNPSPNSPDPQKAPATTFERKSIQPLPLSLRLSPSPEPSRSGELPAIPDDVSRVQTADDGRRGFDERLALYRELFEGRKTTRSESFSVNKSGSEVKNLFDVFMMELKRGSIKSREQAVSFIRTELKDSLVSDLGTMWGTGDTTRPSYYLWGDGSPEGKDTGTFDSQRGRGRTSTWGQRLDDKGEPSPRMIKSSELKLRPRFADLVNVAVEAPEFPMPTSRARSVDLRCTTPQNVQSEESDLPPEYSEQSDSTPRVHAPRTFAAPDLNLLNLIDEKSKRGGRGGERRQEQLPFRRESILREALVHSVTPKPKRAGMIKRRLDSLQPRSSHQGSKSTASRVESTTPSDSRRSSTIQEQPEKEVKQPDTLFSIQEVIQAPTPPQVPTDPVPLKPLKPQQRRASAAISPEQTRRESSSSSPSVESIAEPAKVTEKPEPQPITQSTWRNLFPPETHVTEVDVRRASVRIPKKYDIRVTDALDQFTLNMASSLLTSLALLALHTTKDALAKGKMRAVLDERRTLHKLARSGKKEPPPPPPAKPKAASKPAEEPEKPQESEVKVTIEVSPPPPPAPPTKERVSEASKRSKKTKKRAPAKGSDSVEVEIERNYVSSNIDFELKHLEMLKRLTAQLDQKPPDAETSQFVNVDTEPAEAQEAEEKPPEEHPFHTDYGSAWIQEVMATEPPEDVQALLERIMRDRNLKDMPFSTEISYGFGAEEEDPRFELDLAKIDPSQDPNLEMKEEMEIRRLFLQYCRSCEKNEELLARQKGVFFIAHKDSFNPAEIKQGVREAVKKRRYRERVLKERLEHKQVALRARVVTTFSNLPKSSTQRPLRPKTGFLENLNVDGYAKDVKNELEHRERVYLRIKNEKNLQKLQPSKSARGLFSLTATVKELNSLSARPKTRA